MFLSVKRNDYLWLSLAQTVRSRTLNHFNRLYRLRSNPTQFLVCEITFSISVRIAQARVAPNKDCNKPSNPGSADSDLNPMIRTKCMCSVKCSAAAWNYKSERHSAL